MSGRFVRASKYRHVHGDQPRKDQSYLFESKLSVSGDSNHIATNGQALAVALDAGGGPILIHNMQNVGRVPRDAFKVNVHKSKVLDIAFSPFLDTVVATAGDDGVAHITQFDASLPSGVTVNNPTASLLGHQKKVQWVKWHPVANNVVATASYDKTIKIWDVGSQEEMMSYDFDDVVSSFEWNTQGSLITAACKDKTVRIYDPRQKDAAVVGVAHEGAKAAKTLFLGNSGLVATLGFGRSAAREIKVWDQKDMSKPVSELKLDSGAGVLVPHFDEDTGVLFVGGKGDGNIRYYELEDNTLHYLSEFRSSESQKGITFAPKRSCDTTKCEIALCLRLMRDYAAPVSFQVPRKSDLFQEDIFPDAYAGVAGLEAKEWAEGKDVDPPRVSMKPGEANNEARTATMEVQKSRADLQQELDAAQARIKELEEEVAKLKAS